MNNQKSPTNANIRVKDLKVNLDLNSGRGNSPKNLKNQSPPKMIDLLKAKIKIESPKLRSPGSGVQPSFNYNVLSKGNNMKLVSEKGAASPGRNVQTKGDGKKIDLNDNFNNNLNNIFSALKNSSLMTPSSGISSNISPYLKKQSEPLRSRSKDKERKKSNSPLKFNNLFSNNSVINNKNLKRKEDENINNNVNSSPSNNPSNNAITNIAPINNIQVIRQETPAVSCFKEYAYKEDKNLKFRNAMEDFSKIVEKYMGDPNKALFTLYDGHGGSDPVIYVKDRMPELLLKCLQSKENTTTEAAITQAFVKIDDELKFCDSENTGCTACVVYINIENGKRVLYCANVGDTRSVLVTCDEATTITQDHKCSETAEVERVRESGGIVFSGRVFGQLVLTRALGDHALKSYGVIPTPYVVRTELDDKYKYLVMASDGVWDVVQPDDVFKVSKEVSNAEDFSKVLVKNAIDGGSKDNISCIVVKLN
jgi:serine/threonine protein phosphatase PrpC